MFLPKKGFGVCDGEIDAFDDVGMVIGGEIIVPYFVFEFFFEDVVIAHWCYCCEGTKVGIICQLGNLLMGGLRRLGGLRELGGEGCEPHRRLWDRWNNY